MPSSSRTARSVRTMSATVITGKSEPYGCPVAGLIDDGPGRAAAAAEQVGGDDEEPVGVERLAGADHPVPPAEPLRRGAVAIVGAEAVARALGGRRLRDAGGVRVAAQRVADEDDVVARRRQRAVGLVGDADRMQRAATVELERLRQIEELRLDDACRARGGSRRRGGHARDHSACSRGAIGALYDPGLSRPARVRHAQAV